MAKTNMGKIPSFLVPRGGPNPAQVVGDVVDTVSDVVTLPPTIIRNVKLALRGGKNRIVAALKQGQRPPDPADLVKGVVDELVLGVKSAIGDIMVRMERLTGKGP